MKRPLKIFVAVLTVLVVAQALFAFRLWRAAAYSAPALAASPALRSAQEAGDWKNTFLGFAVLQYPTDLMTYQRLLFDAKPDIVIETGTYRGGLTLYLAVLLENINEQARVLTVDIDPTGAQELLASARIRQSLKDRIRFFAGSSTDSKIVEQIAALARGKNVMVILDSLHERAHVRKELELYSALVPPGGIIVVNDTQLEGTTWLPRGDSGPAGAVSDFVSAHPEFKVTKPERDYAVSCFHSGLLTRIR